MSRRTIIIYANDENIGDSISARGISLLVGSGTRLFPFEGRMAALRAMLAGLDGDTTVIVGGGGLLKSSFDRFWRIILENRARAKFRLILWGVGYCDVVGEDTRGALKLLREVVRHSDGASFRDGLSYEPFADLPGTRIVGCPALHAVRTMGLHSAPALAPRRLLRVDHPDLLAGISRRSNSNAAACFSMTCQQWADERGLKVDATTNMVDRVGNVPKMIRARVGAMRIETRMAANRATKLVAEHYATADVVVTSRLHGAIIAAALDKRVVALSNDSKIDQFMHSVGLAEYVTGQIDESPKILDRIDQQPLIEKPVKKLRVQNNEFAAHLGVVRHSN